MDTINIDNNTKLRILEEILQSEGFYYAKKCQDLLRYLVNASINGDIVKESTLAIEFFSKDAIFDPSIDSSVRAYISNLRKKLEHYYLTDGKEKDIKLVIPKGRHYQVEFLDNKNLKHVLLKKSKLLPHFLYISLILILTFIILLLTFGTDRISQKQTRSYIPINDPIWKNLFTNTRRTLIVLGDYYFFSMPLYPGRINYIRDIKINSDEELHAFISDHPSIQNKVAKTYHTYLDEHIPWCLSYIIPSFIIHNKAIDLKLASEIQLQDLQRCNIIYIGSYKNLHTLQTVTRNLHFQYLLQNDQRILTYFNEDSNKVFTYSWITNPETKARNDYSMVVKVSGYNNNIYLFFLSQHDFGNISIVKYFTNPIHLKEFSARIASDNFQALFEVTGIIRTDFDIKLVHANSLPAGFHIDLE